MEFRIFVKLFLMLNLLVVVASNFNRGIGTNSRLVNEVEEYSTEAAKNHKTAFSIARGQLGSKVLPKNDGQSIGNNANLEKTSAIDERSKKILRFGKRVFESVQKSGMITSDVRLLKSGKYEIDWWRHSRRLNGMKERLFNELQRNPELTFRLHSFGWRNSTEHISNDHNKMKASSFDVNNKQMPMYQSLKNTVMYKLFILGLDTKNPETDAPTKFILSTFDEGGFDGSASDFEVIDVINEDHFPQHASSDNKLFIPRDRSRQVLVENDRLLQLIPLIVDALREGQIPKEERRALKWIFGKRLWQLLVCEASKGFDETMDKKLAKFILKGELPEPEIAPREKHQGLKTLGQKNRKTKWRCTTDQKEQHHRRYKHKNDYYKGMKHRSSIRSDEEEKANPALLSL